MKNTLLLVLAIVFVAIGCTKENQLEVESSISTPTIPQNTSREGEIIPTVKEGRFYFDSEKEFGDYMRQIVNTDIEELQQAHEDLGLISFYTLVNTKSEDGNPLVDPSELNNDVKIVVEDPYFSNVLNHNLELHIGERIYRIEENFAFSYAVGNYDEVLNFNANSNEYELPHDELVKINDELSVAKHSTLENDERLWIFGYGWRVNAGHKSFGHHKNMKSTQWETNVFFYRGIGVKTKYEEKRGWWIFKFWQNTNTEFLKVKWDGRMKMTFSGTHIPVYRNVSGEKSKYNKAVVNETLFMEAGGGITLGGGANPSPNGTITSVDFEFLNTNHTCKRWGTTKYHSLSWIW